MPRNYTVTNGVIAPFTLGAWIETTWTLPWSRRCLMSLPSRGRGSKPDGQAFGRVATLSLQSLSRGGDGSKHQAASLASQSEDVSPVALSAGAWIRKRRVNDSRETPRCRHPPTCRLLSRGRGSETAVIDAACDAKTAWNYVAPFAGARIETVLIRRRFAAKVVRVRRSLRRGRGSETSTPSASAGAARRVAPGRSLHGGVDPKPGAQYLQPCRALTSSSMCRSPLAGAWIETPYVPSRYHGGLSVRSRSLSRGRGSKHCCGT